MSMLDLLQVLQSRTARKFESHSCTNIVYIQEVLVHNLDVMGRGPNFNLV